MKKAKRKVYICLSVVILIAVVMGLLYYLNELDKHALQGEGTLVAAMHAGWKTLWQ